MAESAKTSNIESLSARRAWIEIGVDFAEDWLNAVALRKESVDRNNIALASFRACTMSLSARRAWIEIVVGRSQGRWQPVALRKESVDRNILLAPLTILLISRSPQGERG